MTGRSILVLFVGIPALVARRLRVSVHARCGAAGVPPRLLPLACAATTFVLLLTADEGAADFIVTTSAQVDWVETIDGYPVPKHAGDGGSKPAAVASGGGGSARVSGTVSGSERGSGLLSASTNATAGGRVTSSSAFGYVRADVGLPLPGNNVVFGYSGSRQSEFTVYRDGMMALGSAGSLVANYGFMMAINSSSTSYLDRSGTANLYFSWAPIGRVLPGKSKDEYLSPDPPGTPYSDDDDDGLGVPPSEVSGPFSVGDAGAFGSQAPHVQAKFATPVVDDYGRDSPLFFDPTASGSHLYTVADNLITTMVIPDPLPGGDDEFSVRFGDEGQFDLAIHSGVPFDFRDFVTGGISWFVLSGLDLSDSLRAASAAPFVTGLTFANNGIQRLRVWTTEDSGGTPVPEPATLTMSCIAIGFYGALRLRRRAAE